MLGIKLRLAVFMTITLPPSPIIYSLATAVFFLFLGEGTTKMRTIPHSALMDHSWWPYGTVWGAKDLT